MCNERSNFKRGVRNYIITKRRSFYANGDVVHLKELAKSVAITYIKKIELFYMGFIM